MHSEQKYIQELQIKSDKYGENSVLQHEIQAFTYSAHFIMLVYSPKESNKLIQQWHKWIQKKQKDTTNWYNYIPTNSEGHRLARLQR